MSEFILTASPDFAELAQDELQKTGFSVRRCRPLDSGIFLVELEESFWDLAEIWRLDPPVFIRHICPVLTSIELNGSIEDIQRMVDGLDYDILSLVEPDLTFSVQSRTLGEFPYKRFDINTALASEITKRTKAEVNVRSPVQIISVVCATLAQNDGSLPRSIAFIGISPAIYNLSDWAGGMRRFAREEGQVSRSEFKLLEALEVFHIELPHRGVALDLGAAPGGWTRVLRQHEQYVTAVDPGALDPRIAADRSVRHLRITAEQYLAQDPEQFDLIVNDMRIDARDSARLMVRYASCLYPHGIALMSLKLPEQNRKPILDHSWNILRVAYTIEGARQLFHNRSEVTVYLKLR
ncbi:50S rRNA methyltransferase [Chloroflexi bacterium TSY]|nr:50S rRNA methyltransferase [Chloroflexi bacterium TSY]